MSVPKPKGGRVQADNKPRTAGPGALSQRTDLVAGKQPVMLPGGQPYGDRQMLEGAQEAIPLQSGGPIQQQASQGPPQGGSAQGPPMAPGDIAQLLAHGTQAPQEPVTAAPEGPPPAQVVNAAQLASALEPIVQSGVVSQGLMDLYLGLRDQARLGDPPSTRTFSPEPIPAYKLAR